MHVVSGAVPEVPRPEDHRPLTPEDLSADQLRVLRAAKAVFTVALCGVPDTTAMLAAAPAVLVREKEAGVATPVVEAVTV